MISSGIFQIKNIFKTDKKQRTDSLFLLSVILVTLYGTLMVFSAGTAYAQARYNDQFYFIKKQALWLIIGFLVMYVASRINLDVYQKYTPYFYGFTLFLLVLVLVVGFVGNGAQRWIDLKFTTLQPSDLTKIFLILF